MEEDMREMITFLSKYSLYAFEEDIKSGFITLEGGHRVGIAGQVRMEDKRVADIRYISFLNIRIAKQRKNCSKEIIPYMIAYRNIYNTLIVSPPGIGKTTYLRDCIRILSNGTAYLKGQKVCVIDERSEIAACHLGVPQNDVGIRTDVLDRCSKAQGMLLMLRSMSPQIIAVDELGSKEDYLAVEQALNCGSRILGTVHAGNIQELEEKEIIGNWVRERIFGRYIILKKMDNGNRKFEIYNEKLEQLC
jgi:stage III sporulation protein AA